VKLSDWADKQVMDIGPELWARQVIVKAIRDLGTDEDPVVFATLTGSTRDQPLVTLSLLAALSTGLATVSVTTDPSHSKDAELSLSIVPWSTIVPTLRLEMTGDPDERLTIAMTIGNERIEARSARRAELTAFYLEVSRVAKA
jgi:hypothetical protein